MKAIVQDVYGSPGLMELREVAKPHIKDDEVLVRVRAASVNPPDWAGVTGVPYIVRANFGLRKPRNRVRGTDLAGIVEAVGKNVKRLMVGDEVFGKGRGTFAEYAAAAAAYLVPKPANVGFEQAASIPMSGLTALHALRDVGGVESGQQVLITGAGGGIGTFAVQIAKSFGAEVTGVCSTTKVDLVRSIGADHVIDYTKENFTQSEKRYDVIFDNVLNHPLSRLVRVVSRQGTLIPNGGQFHKRWIAATGVILIKAPIMSLFVPPKIRHVSEAPNQDDLRALKELIESGKVVPTVGSTYPLSRTSEAVEHFARGHARGKIVITM
jgi:NADPH:quinone reductase-like Zn-dependent oxidoreductase